MHYEVLDELFEDHIPAEAYADDWDLASLTEAVYHVYGVSLSLTPEEITTFSREALLEHIQSALDSAYADKKQAIGQEQFKGLTRWVTLQVIDKHWKDHLLAMDHLKEGIGLRGYGQKNPLNEYKREGFEMFVDMTNRIKADVVEYLFKVQITNPRRHHDRAATPTPSAHRSPPRELPHGTRGGGERRGQNGPASGGKNRPQCALSLR